MLVRVWNTTYDVNQTAKLVDYANRVSLPVLSSRPGNCGVFFFSDSARWTTLTLWSNQQSIDDLEQDPEYAKIVEGIMALGILGDQHDTQVKQYEGGTT